MKDYHGLIIKKGGKLSKSLWNTEIREHVEIDVTKTAFCHLFEPCILDKDVTLKDIFLLLKTNMDVARVIIGNWVEEIVTEGLTGIPTLPQKGEEIEYLELYWIFSRARDYEPFPEGPRKPEPGSIHERLDHEWTGEFTGPKQLQGYLRPDFHGIGPILSEDRLHDWKDSNGNPAVEYPKGHRINWGIGMSKACDLAHLPVILNQQICICDDVVNKDYSTENTEVYDGCEYSLGQILYGIIWEMSFFGTPEDRDEMRDELKGMVDEIKKETSDETKS